METVYQKILREQSLKWRPTGSSYLNGDGRHIDWSQEKLATILYDGDLMYLINSSCPLEEQHTKNYDIAIVLLVQETNGCLSGGTSMTDSHFR